MKIVECYRKLYFLGRQGSALTTVLVLASMVGLFGLAVMQTSKNQSESQRNIHVRDAADKVTDNIRSILQHHKTCKLNFKNGPGFTSKTQDGNGIFTAITNDVQPTPTPLFEKGIDKPYHNYGYLKSITYIFDSTKEITEMTLTFTKYKPIAGLRGLLATQRGRTIQRKILIKMNFCQQEDLDADTAHSDCDGAARNELKNCFALFGDSDASAFSHSNNPLNDACTNLGGEFDTTTGTCKTVQHQSALIKEGKVHGIDGLCKQMGGAWDPSDGGKCKPILSGEPCPTGEILIGWHGQVPHGKDMSDPTKNGMMICAPPPPP